MEHPQCYDITANSTICIWSCDFVRGERLGDKSTIISHLWQPLSTILKRDLYPLKALSVLAEPPSDIYRLWTVQDTIDESWMGDIFSHYLGRGPFKGEHKGHF